MIYSVLYVLKFYFSTIGDSDLRERESVWHGRLVLQPISARCPSKLSSPVAWGGGSLAIYSFIHVPPASSGIHLAV